MSDAESKTTTEEKPPEAADAAGGDSGSDENTADAPSEAKAEDSPSDKADDAKAGDAKADDAKADDTKADDAKADDAKADEPKKEKKGKVAAKLAAGKTKGQKKKKQGQRIGEQEEPEKTAQDIFLENLPTIVVIAIIFAVIPVLWTSRQADIKRSSETAWAELAAAKRKSPTGDTGFAELAKKHKGTTALPYIHIAWASRLYETGEQKKVKEAHELLLKVLSNNKENAFIQRTVKPQADAILAELNDKRVPWPKAGAAPAPKPAKPAPAHDPNDGADHSGHDHAKTKKLN